MKLQQSQSVPTSSRTWRLVRNLAVAVIATIPIGACSPEAADEPTASDITDPTGTTRSTDQPSPTVTVTAPPTTLARALFGKAGERFEPGTYYVDSFEGTRTARVHVTLGDGWRNDFDGWSVANPNGYFTFSRPDAVLSDACHPTEGYHPGPMTTLDGLVTALSEQKGWVEVTAVSDISIDGFTGKAFQRRSPADFGDCTRGNTSPDNLLYPFFPSWENGVEGNRSWSYYGPDTVEMLNVFDLDGTIVILSMRASLDQLAAAGGDLAAILDSVRIDAQ